SATFPAAIELVSENLVEVQLARPFDSEQAIQPSIELRKSVNGKEEVYQSFQFLTNRQSSEESANTTYTISFTVTDSVDLYIPSLSSRPLAKITVKQLPYPNVNLALKSALETP